MKEQAVSHGYDPDAVRRWRAWFDAHFGRARARILACRRRSVAKATG
jgi:hypothetical protein